MENPFSRFFPQQLAQPPGPAATVNAAVKPPMPIGKYMLMAGGFVLFLFWLTARDFKNASPASPVDKTQSVSVASPDKSASMFGLAQQTKAQNAMAIDANLARQNQQLSNQNPVVGEGQPAEKSAQEKAAERAERERERLWKARFAPGLLSAPDTERSEPVQHASAAAPTTGTPVASAAPLAPVDPYAAPPAAPAVAATPEKKKDARSDCLDVKEGDERLYAICEGKALFATTQIRLNGDFAGPVKAVLDQDVYSRDRQHLLFPKGTEFIGKAAKVEQAYQQRLDVKFHRILFTDGHGYLLNDAPALEPAGDIALKDKVNRHLFSTFSAAVGLGVLAGFAQSGTGGALTGSGMDMYRQGMAQQFSQNGQQILSRQMNRPNSITIREGHPIIIYLTEDVHVPEYAPNMTISIGGK